ncbi:MAG: hypothetical protein J5496_00820 [Lachnospiraceae bacterium]|nr:hypothetical protein [Lachnospiraceae bacterium]
MLKEIFLQAVTLSLSATLIALLVMALRPVLKKAPRALICALWLLVAVRLLIPSLPRSSVSVVPQTVSEGTIVQELSGRPVEKTVKVREYEPEYVTIISRQPQLPVKSEAAAGSPVGSAAEAEAGQEIHYVEVSAATKEAPKTFGDAVLPVLAVIWLAGVGGMLLYMAVSWLRVRKKVQVSCKERNNIYLCDHLTSPFILGVIRPRIYLPSALGEDEKSYVLAHEEAHLKRLDHVWKPLGFLLLSVYWFNPVMWIAYILLCRDIELACDEKVIGREDDSYKMAYSQALMACSTPQKRVTACPLAFGEVGVKARVKSVLQYKKPAFWILAGALIVSLIAAGCALTDPKNSTEDPAGSGVAEQSTAESTPESTPDMTEPAGTEPAGTEESTEHPTDPSEQNNPVRYEIGRLRADQEAVLRADQESRLFISRLSSSLAPNDPEGANDFALSREEDSFLLGRSGKYLYLFAKGEEAAGPRRIVSLEFCRDPRSAVRFSAGWASSDAAAPQIYYAVLDTDTVYLLEDAAVLAELPAWRLGEPHTEKPAALSVPLPGNMTADDVREMARVTDQETQSDVLILISDRCGNWRLDLPDEKWVPTELGYQLSREGDTVTVRSAEAVWMLEIPQKDVRILGTVSDASLSLCVVEDDGQSASLYWIDAVTGGGSGEGPITYGSRIDMSDWNGVPEHFARGSGNFVRIMAPRWDGVTFYAVTVGQSSVMQERPMQNLSGLRERILGGEVIALMDGAEITDAFPGFSLDLDGDGSAESFSIENGVNPQRELCREIYLNGRAAGYSHQVYQSALNGDSSLELLHWPEEGSFRKNAGYRLYLASMDGEHILIFLSNEEQTFGLDFAGAVVQYTEKDAVFARARIRGIGKTMADFVPNRSLEEYIAEGWLCRPRDGDRLDVNGCGEKNLLRVSYSYQRIGLPAECIGVCPTGDSQAEPVYQAAVTWTEPGRTDAFRYDQLYYWKNEYGWYDLIGEIRFGDESYSDHLTLVNASGEQDRGSIRAGVYFAALKPDVESYPDPYPYELFRDQSLLRTSFLLDHGKTEVLFHRWVERITEAFENWALEAHRIRTGEIPDLEPDYTVRLSENLELSGLRKERLKGSLVRENIGKTEYYGWINGEAFWLPKGFVDVIEDWYRMPMEEQLETLNPDFYEYIYAQVGPEQREKLEALYPEIRNSQSISGYRREILIRAGLLAEDTPRLTLEQAETICREIKEQSGEGSYNVIVSQIVKRFDAIAGAPDWIGGSGIGYIHYYLDDKGVERVGYSTLFGIFYSNKNTGETAKLLSQPE